MLALNMFLKTKEKLNKFSISHFKEYAINFIEKKSTLDILPRRDTDAWSPFGVKFCHGNMQYDDFYDGYVLVQG